jgi:methyl-accepting chemotaxis protein
MRFRTNLILCLVTPAALFSASVLMCLWGLSGTPGKVQPIGVVASLLMLLGFVSAIALGWQMITRVNREIGGDPAQARSAIGRMAQGDLGPLFRNERLPEGSVLAALSAMQTARAKLIGQFRVVVESFTLASSQIAAGNIDLSARTEQQAASLVQTAARMTELTEMVQQNADHARHANALAASATDIAGAGGGAVEGMVGTIGKISESSTKISEITGIIEGIAFQTNILALNAAVEAARGRAWTWFCRGGFGGAQSRAARSGRGT